MTNIVKDVTDDWPRDWCFIPETVCASSGTSSQNLLNAGASAEGIAAVDQINKHARRFYADAVAYVVALPASTPALRRFCLLPMLLAGKTLELALGNGAVVDPNKAVKVTREVVGQTIEQVESLLQDEQALRTLCIAEPVYA